MARKPGGYRKPTEQQRQESRIEKKDFLDWFSQIWEMPGASTKNGHPAPFPLELATRLVRMFSFVGDTVIDPFCGSGTTMLASMNTNRNSIGVETEEYYCLSTIERLNNNHDFFTSCKIQYEDISHETDHFTNT